MKNFLQSLFHHAGLPIFTFSVKGKITNWNSLCEKLLGFSTKEAKGMYFSELIPEKSLLDVQTVLSSVISSKKPMSAFITLIGKDEQGKTLNCIFSPVSDESGFVISISVIIHYTDSVLNNDNSVGDGKISSLKELVNKALNGFSTVFVNSGISLKNNIFEENNKVDIKEKTFFKILTSILTNAVNSFDINSQKKEIALTLNTTDENFYILNVRDSGRGMSDSQLKMIFSNNDDNKSDDVLSLKQCKDLLVKNNGDLKIMSKENRGTIVSLILPKADNKQEKDNDIEKLNKLFEGKSVLLLDSREGDELKNISLNCKFDKVKYGNEGILQLNQNKYDYLIVDFHTPEFDGFQFFEWILDEKPYLSDFVIFIIKDQTDENIMSFLKKHNIKYITRPVTVAKLIEQEYFTG
jgi:PAS domain S-box-containing protein